MGLSMTAFSVRRLRYGRREYSIEMKSYNSRYLDVQFKLPPFLSAMEPSFDGAIRSAFKRGKLDLTIKVLESQGGVIGDSQRAREIAQALKALAKECDLDRGPSLADILAVEALDSSEARIEEGECQALLREFMEGIEELKRRRREEGERLNADIQSSLNFLTEETDAIGKAIPEIERRMEKTIRDRFLACLADKVDENRVLQELAASLLRLTVNEELVRLDSHLTAIRGILDEEEVGKRLDFYCQELNREVNTIGSKVQDAYLAGRIVLMKEGVEKLREQARNLE